MKTHPRREFLLRVLAACGTPLVAAIPANAAQAPQTEPGANAAGRAAMYFGGGAGVDAARAIGEAYVRYLKVEPTREAILENTASTLEILARERNQKAALAELVAAVRRDFQEGRVVQLEGWIVSRTEAELCALTLLAAAGQARVLRTRELHI